MNAKFKKLAIATGVSAALAGVSMPSLAIVQGLPGDALLVPFVWYSSAFNVDTIVELTAVNNPGGDQLNTIGNTVYTSSCSFLPLEAGAVTATVEPSIALSYSCSPYLDGDPSSGTSPLPPVDPSSASTVGSQLLPNTVHWYFFDSRSHHRADGLIPMSDNDYYFFDWKVERGAALDGMKGYLVFTDKRANDGKNSATFNQFADAYATVGAGPFVWSASLPVLPMTDNTDLASCGILPSSLPSDGVDVCLADQVYYGGSSIPVQVSPLYAGIRTSYPDGNTEESAILDLPLSQDPGASNPWAIGSIHVVWNDMNRSSWNGVLVDIFDNDENYCSVPANLPNELNVLWLEKGVSAPTSLLVDPTTGKGLVDSSVDTTCDPTVTGKPGYARYHLPEGVDGVCPSSSTTCTNPPIVSGAPTDTTYPYSPQSSAAAFAIVFPGHNSVPPAAFVLGHERGMYTD